MTLFAPSSVFLSLQFSFTCYAAAMCAVISCGTHLRQTTIHKMPAALPRRSALLALSIRLPWRSRQTNLPPFLGPEIPALPEVTGWPRYESARYPRLLQPDDGRPRAQSAAQWIWSSPIG